MPVLSVLHKFTYLVLPQSYKGGTLSLIVLMNTQRHPCQGHLDEWQILSQAQPGSICALELISGLLSPILPIEQLCLFWALSLQSLWCGVPGLPPSCHPHGVFWGGSGCLWSCSTQSQLQCSWGPVQWAAWRDDPARFWVLCIFAA